MESSYHENLICAFEVYGFVIQRNEGIARIIGIPIVLLLNIFASITGMSRFHPHSIDKIDCFLRVARFTPRPRKTILLMANDAISTRPKLRYSMENA